MHGFFICENKAGTTVTVENVGTGRKLKVFDNGIGGLAADLHKCSNVKRSG